MAAWKPLARFPVWLLAVAVACSPVSERGAPAILPRPGSQSLRDGGLAPMLDSAAATDAAAGSGRDGQSAPEVASSDLPPVDRTGQPDVRSGEIDGSTDLRDVAPTPPAPGKLVFGPWPGSAAVMAVDQAGRLGGDLSGLSYLPARDGRPPALLAVQNTSKLHRLVEQGAVWVRDPGGGWSGGKRLRYPGGAGAPDAEGVTIAESPAIAYVASESNTDDDASRPGILRFDLSGTGTTLTATNEWNLTADLPRVEVNLGLESIAWVPDSHLVARGFWDESAKAVYQPGRYPDHGAGLFLVALEDVGTIYAYALDHRTNKFQRVATIASGQPAVMDLAFDADQGVLWAACDETCDGRITLLAIDASARSPTSGRFVVWRGLSRPTGMPNTNNEGISFGPVATCLAGQRPFFWADDSALDDHALRRGSIPCDPLF